MECLGSVIVVLLYSESIVPIVRATLRLQLDDKLGFIDPSHSQATAIWISFPLFGESNDQESNPSPGIGVMNPPTSWERNIRRVPLFGWLKLRRTSDRHEAV